MKKKLDLTGYTDFERAVWQVVKTIPRGEMRTYDWVAKRIGRPRAARAVGQALKKNPYPGLIPCHRVICSDGSLGGFSQGKEIKKRWLQRERKKDA